MTVKSRSLRTHLLIGASIGSMLLAGVAEAQDRSGGRISGGRGGADPAAAAARAAQAQAVRADQTNSASRRAIEAFRRAAETRQQMHDAQIAARAAARAAQSNVPNGLGQGGLQVANGVELDPSLWIGAEGPTQSQGEDGRTNVAIDQTQQRAILTWDSFNVGRETDLTFNQGGADWVALNRVTDVQADPTRILGSIKADGSVYIINRNGIIFGGASQVNVRNLVASTAGITNDQFLERGIYSATQGGSLTPSFTGAGGSVSVEAGALITTHDPATVTQGGGYVLLLGANVENAGAITTNRGQTLLAAGDDFLVRPGLSSEVNAYSSTRGNEVNALLAADSLSGTVTNSGLITAHQGDITLTGHAVRQAGVLLSTTSVNQRGTIHLLNSASDATGSVVLASGSLTTILPELESDDTALNSQRDALIADSAAQDAARATAVESGLDNLGQFDNLSRLTDRRDQSRVEIVTGGDLVFEGSSQTIAQGGQVAASAVGRINVRDGAEINVSGVRNVVLDPSSNAISVNIQGFELRDSPANREAALLNNQNVWVDVRDLVYVPDGVGGYDGERYYTPGGLLEVSGALGLQAHTIDEWTSLGGTITLQASEVVAEQGAVFDVSGGSLDYASGNVRSTRIMGADGRMYDIRNAPAHLKMLAVGNAFARKHDRWGEMYTEVYSHPLFSRGTSTRWEDGYTVGRDAGRLILSAPTVVLEADVVADVVRGERQTDARPSGVTDGYKLSQNTVAQAGTLVISRVGARGADGAFESDVVIGDVADISGTVDGVTPPERLNTVMLDADRLNGYGLGGLSITTAGGVAIDRALTLTDGGALTLTAATTAINADVTARSGSVTVGNVAPVGLDSVPPQILTREGTSSFTVADGATIDLRGIWTNGLLDNDEAQSTAFVDGGDLSVRMVFGSVTLAEGSVVDVSSGATLLADGNLVGGRGGNVSLIAGASPSDIAPAPMPGGVGLTLDGELRAEGVLGGGTLTLQSPTTVVFGEDSFLDGGVLAGGTPAPTGLILAEAVTIPVGGIVPIDRSLSLDSTIPDAPLPGWVQPLNQTPIVTAADWTVPDSVFVYTSDGGYFEAGATLPAATQITYFSSIPEGTFVSSSVFPEGIPVQRYTVSFRAGDTTPIPLTYESGQLVTPGTVFAERVAVEPALRIDAHIFRSGFSDYRVTSLAGLQITEGVAIAPQTPVLRLTEDAFDVPTGAAPGAALESWTPPVYLEDPVLGQLTQREGASLTLRAADLAMASGASLTVDPGESVRLAAAGQITIDGTITAAGGDISIQTESVGTLVGLQESALPGRSIWIGENAVLDVAGRAYTAADSQGLRYGVAGDGGSIRIGIEDLTPVDRDFLGATNAHVVIREGARLEASGASVEIDAYSGATIPGARETVRLAGDGGLIRIGSTRGIINDGDMQAAAGGAGAAGGTLNLVLENIPSVAYGVRSLTITQERAGSSFPDGLAPGDDDPWLTVGAARISVEEVEAGGFGTLDLWSRDVFNFEGDVDLSVGESLALRRGAFAVSDLTPEAQVSLAAPHVLLDGKVAVALRDGEILPGLTGRSGGYTDIAISARNMGTLTIEADLIDVTNDVHFGASGDIRRGIGNQTETVPLDFAGFAAVDLTSRGDLRFTDGLLASGLAMTLTAAQIYPTTGASGTVRVGQRRVGNNFAYDPASLLTIRGYGGDAPPMPLTAFGSLSFSATTIDQGGIVRAPLGRILFGREPERLPFLSDPSLFFDVTLREGSITSTSAAGLVLPYGGTVDDLTYLYNGEEVSFLDLAHTRGGADSPIDLGVIFGQAELTAEEGSLLDLSGGGELLGAGFVTGRGGSVDVLRAALVDANPAYGFSDGDAEVYAIVPGHPGAYAPTTPDAGFGAPAVGRQITLDTAVGDLPAGTYTLMPSTFALLPGAFRIELGHSGVGRGPIADLPDGSFRTTGFLGTANTSVRDALPTAITLTPADKVRTFSQYNETSYAEFAIANAATFGALRPRLERDASMLQIDFGARAGDVLDFDGMANLTAAEGGVSGTLFVTANNAIEIKAADAPESEGFTSLDADDLAAFDAGALVIGGTFGLEDAREAPELGNRPLGPRIVFSSNQETVAVRGGAMLTAGQVFLTGRDVVVEDGAVIDTTAGPTDGLNSSLGYVFSDTLNNRNVHGGAILTVANGFIDFTAPLGAGADGVNSITVEDGASLRTLGTISFSTNGPVGLGEADLSARYITLVVPELNIGTDISFAEAEAAGILGSGVRLSQSLLERLARPTEEGAIPVERISLTVGNSINFFGDVALDLRAANGGAEAALVLNTPAIYGWGGTEDGAVIRADTLVWSGLATGAGTPGNPYASALPGTVTPGGAGTGTGSLTIDAREIVFGYDSLARPQDQVTLDRVALGFSAVNLNASERITANTRGALSAYATGTDADSYAGGTLNITTPVLTGEAGSFMAYRTGGALTIAAPDGAAFDTSTIDALGAEVRLAGRSVTVDTAVALPSGRLVVEAVDDITFAGRADIDLSGRAIDFFDVTKHSWGGDLVLEATDGAIIQAAGSVIDVSAENNDAGTMKVTATGEGGTVAFGGALLGAATEDFVSGAIDIRTRALDDFAGLNTLLNSGGFFEARSFVVQSGNLVIGDGVRARKVTISADGGSLTVDGMIDASGRGAGTIRLSARDDLTLTGNAVLDAHGTELVVDSYGQAIEASNRGEVELTTASGSINLAGGALIDLTSADGVARGRVEINAPRLGGNDVAVNAATGLTVRGADSIAVNAFAVYTPADGIVDQAYLDLLHTESSAFIDAAHANGEVAARMAGLGAYGDAFHLRPGVEIRSDGDLTVERDLDLSGYRYGPGADPGLIGSGEPGVLTLRAAGDLLVNGNITDGFAPPPVTPDDELYRLIPGEIVSYPAGTTRPDDWWLEADLPLQEDWVVPDTPFYQNFLGLVYDTNGTYYGPGETIPAGTTLAAWNTAFEANTPLPSYTAETPSTYEPGRMWAVAPMLAPGSLSWSMRLVGGADLASADSRTLTAQSRLGGRGDVVLSDPHLAGPLQDQAAISVVRTGTGYLDVLAGGDYRQESLYGVYTAGTQVAGTGAWDVGRAPTYDGTVIGDPGYEATLNAQRMYFTEGGGDLLLAAQGNVRGFNEINTMLNQSTDDIGRWLWRQGGEELGQLTAWGVNFGQYRFSGSTFSSELVGFNGIGTLGGGDVTILAGGDAGSDLNLEVSPGVPEPFLYDVSALNVVIGGSGRVAADGTLTQTGGGTLKIDVGGRINAGLTNFGSTANGGVVANLRGDTTIRAGSVGQTLETSYGVKASGDPRAVDTRTPLQRLGFGRLGLAVGDGAAAVASRNDLIVLTLQDAGRTPMRGGDTFASDGLFEGGGTTSFTLWTDRSAISLFAGGGDVLQSKPVNLVPESIRYDAPQFSAVAADGSISVDLILAPSASGGLELLARENLFGSASVSGGNPAFLATPENPLWLLDGGPANRFTRHSTNYYSRFDNPPEAYDIYDDFSGSVLFGFGTDTATGLHAGATEPIRFYAAEGDIVLTSGIAAQPTEFRPENFYIAAKPVDVRAGRDILANLLILNNDPDDISIVRAGRDILNTELSIAGPGLLEVTAGRNVYQAAENFALNDGTIDSIGPVVVGDTRDGASIALIVGVGASGPDYASFAALYFDAANLADPERPLADQPGKVVKTYDQELLAWLTERFGYDGDEAGALAYFQGLPEAQQGVFVRDVYYKELRQGGREYNDPDSLRFASYLRGRNAISTLLPEEDAGGQPIAYDGSITYLGSAGTHTDFGGDIQLLVPGGGVTLGATGVAPPPTTGLLTQGTGDIEVYTQDSILLGLSRVFTTFGGGITMWSAEGDINAGRGAKGTVVFAPVRRLYDIYGNVDLSPAVPTSGAGIGTLNPIPEVPAGDIDLIAPLGTIDAGEAGIRVSGNVNLAALQVVNAANIQVQGEAAGIPTAVVVNTGALTAASSASTAVAAQAAQLAERSRPEPIRDIPTIFTVRLLGFGE